MYAAIVFVLVAVMIGLPAVLGQRHHDRATGIRYESGIRPAGGLPRRLPLEFYQVAIFFVVFDLEVAFIFAWAVAARDLGWSGYAEMAVFVALLAVALAYVWLHHGLDWGDRARRRRDRSRGV